ncbi:MAG: glucose-6-phosphate isomerase [Rhodobacteraceae bacterium]|nr:MAG: glucose-6-phosphate isomerase [Paracoccaceae bacterium]
MNWSVLKEHKERLANARIEGLFASDRGRAEGFCAQAGDLRLDYSKTLIDDGARAALLDLCRAAGLDRARAAMFAGAPINDTENRAVLHTALRNLDGGPVLVDGVDVMPGIRETLARMADFAGTIRSGGRFDDVINIGIGGSDLGPAMVTAALAPWQDGPRCHFVSNVDGAHVADTLRGLDPRRTLVIVASKTFTTIETMTNARTVRDWMTAGGGDPARQFAAVSSARDRTAAFGIDPAHVFGFGDWVGGRYSVWGPVGLAPMIAVGAEAFHAFLQGAQAMDLHFRTARGADNLPVMLALTGIWHHQVMGHPTRAVLPYDQRLALLPGYLQQLEMESNGKGVTRSGAPLEGTAGPIVWGAPGTNGQHAFYQLIHQGRQVVPCEFMVAARGHEPDLDHQHRLLVANCLAQSQALMRGRTLDEARALLAGRYQGEELDRQARHRVFPGNRPSVTFSYPQLTPFTLGQLIAAYEHRVFVEGVILGINSFDQWGVELGKELATALQPAVDGDAPPEGLDPSTRALLAHLRQHRG